MPQDLNPEVNYAPEIVSRFQQFVNATNQFETNYNSWLQNSRAILETPGALDMVRRVGNNILLLSDDLILTFNNGELAGTTDLTKLDEIVYSINQLTTTVQSMESERNSFIQQENIESQPSLSGFSYIQYLGIQAIHDAFTLIKQETSISVIPYDAFNFGPSVTIEDLTEISQESLVQLGLDNPVASQVLNLVGISNMQDFQGIKDQEFDFTKLPAVIGLVSLSIPSEISQIADFVVDFLETTLILGLVQFNRNEVLNSPEVAPILEQNQVLNLFAIGSRLPEFLSNLNLEPELVDDIQELLQELLNSMSEPSQLTVGELADYISIAISIIATIMTVGVTLPAKAANLSVRTARLAMGATNTSSFRLWSKASTILARISRRTSALHGLAVPPALLTLDGLLAGTPGAHLMPNRVADIAGNLNRGSEVPSPVQEAIESLLEASTHTPTDLNLPNTQFTPAPEQLTSQPKPEEPLLNFTPEDLPQHTPNQSAQSVPKSDSGTEPTLESLPE